MNLKASNTTAFELCTANAVLGLLQEIVIDIQNQNRGDMSRLTFFYLTMSTLHNLQIVLKNVRLWPTIWKFLTSLFTGLVLSHTVIWKPFLILAQRTWTVCGSEARWIISWQFSLFSAHLFKSSHTRSEYTRIFCDLSNIEQIGLNYRLDFRICKKGCTVWFN